MKKQFALTLLAASLALTACNQQSGVPTAASGASTPASASAPAAGLETESKQLGYMVGYDMASMVQLGEQVKKLKEMGVEVDTDTMVEAIKEQMAGKPSRMTPDQAKVLLEGISKKVMAAEAKRASEEAAQASEAGKKAISEGAKFLEENKTKEGVKVSSSGLQYKVNKEGTGAQVALGDAVAVEYEGRLIDGTVFDGTKQNGGTPFTFPLVSNSPLIKGWIEGLQLMKEGGEYTLYIPASLAYGTTSPSPKIPANSVLVFDMKIVKVEKGGATKAQPAAIPEKAKK